MIDAKTVNEQFKEHYSKEERKSNRYTHWASDAGHPCSRYLYLAFTQWNDIPPLPAEIRPRLETGKALHKLAEEEFRQAGYNVHTSPDSLRDDELRVSGKADFDINRNGDPAVPVEVKTMDDHVVDQYDTIEDILKTTKWYIRKDADQLTLYCWMKNKERGILYLRGLKRYKLIDLSILDPVVIEHAHKLLEKLKAVNGYIDRKEVPNVIPYDETICKRCNAAHLCMRDTPAKGEFVADEELEGLLERRDMIIKAHKEYNELDKAIKKKCKDQELNDVVVGRFNITGKWSERKLKPQPERITKAWTTTIKPLVEKT